MGSRVHGRSFEDLLAAAADASASVVADCPGARPLKTIEIAWQAKNFKALVANFLAKVLHALDRLRNSTWTPQ